MAKKKRKTVTQLEKELSAARRSAKNAHSLRKEYKKGIQDGIELAEKARRN